MAYSIMEALFDGKVIPWERPANMTAERKKIERKIESERRYFIEKMSLDDCQRFEKMLDLYCSAAHHEDVDTYSHGFTLGALLMLEVMEQKERFFSE